MWSPRLKHPEQGNQLQSDALLHFCQVLMLLLVILVVIILIIRDKLKYGQRKEAYSLTCMLCFYVLFMLDMLLQIFNMPEMSDILSKKT